MFMEEKVFLDGEPGGHYRRYAEARVAASPDRVLAPTEESLPPLRLLRRKCRNPTKRMSDPAIDVRNPGVAAV